MSEFEFLRDVTIGQYLPTNSAFHRLDPRAKLLMVTFFLIGIVFGDSLTGLLAALAIVFVGLAWARIPLSFALRGLRPVWPFLVLLALPLTGPISPRLYISLTLVLADLISALTAFSP